MGKRLYVGNLPFSSTEQDLHDLFGATGQEIVEVKLVMDRETGRPRGFAFVEMATDEGATAVIEALNNKDFQGRTLAVNEARERTGGGGGGRGGFGGGGRGGRGGFGGGGDRGDRGGRGGRGGGRGERW